VLDTLNSPEDSRFFKADPTGERALLSAETVRKNLRLLYRSGKIDKTQAMGQLVELKGSLRNAICDPEQLSSILSQG
jgi:hypothetical protein